MHFGCISDAYRIRYAELFTAGLHLSNLYMIFFFSMNAVHDDEEWQCFICEEYAVDHIHLNSKFLEITTNKRGVLVDIDDLIWIRCINCDLTFHAKCSGSFKNKSYLEIRKLGVFTCCHSEKFHRENEHLKKRNLKQFNKSD